MNKNYKIENQELFDVVENLLCPDLDEREFKANKNELKYYFKQADNKTEFAKLVWIYARILNPEFDSYEYSLLIEAATNCSIPLAHNMSIDFDSEVEKLKK